MKIVYASGTTVLEPVKKNEPTVGGHTHFREQIDASLMTYVFIALWGDKATQVK